MEALVCQVAAHVAQDRGRWVGCAGYRAEACRSGRRPALRRTQQAQLSWQWAVASCWLGFPWPRRFSARCYVSVRCSRARAGGAQVRCRQPGLAQVRVRSSARSVAVSWSCCACGSCAAAPARCCALRAAIPVGLGRWGAVFSSGFVSRWLCGVALRVQGRRSQIEAAQAGAQTCLMRGSRPHCSSLACRRHLGARPGALGT